MLSITLPHVQAWNAWFTWFGNSPEAYPALRDQIDAACRAVGRDPATLERTLAVLVTLPGGEGRPQGSHDRPPVGSHLRRAGGAGRGATGVRRGGSRSRPARRRPDHRRQHSRPRPDPRRYSTAEHRPRTPRRERRGPLVAAIGRSRATGGAPLAFALDPEGLAASRCPRCGPATKRCSGPAAMNDCAALGLAVGIGARTCRSKGSGTTKPSPCADHDRRGVASTSSGVVDHRYSGNHRVRDGLPGPSLARAGSHVVRVPAGPVLVRAGAYLGGGGPGMPAPRRWWSEPRPARTPMRHRPAGRGAARGRLAWHAGRDSHLGSSAQGFDQSQPGLPRLRSDRHGQRRGSIEVDDGGRRQLPSDVVERTIAGQSVSLRLAAPSWTAAMAAWSW